jgi:hypothetical protein
MWHVQPTAIVDARAVGEDEVLTAIVEALESSASDDALPAGDDASLIRRRET